MMGVVDRVYIYFDAHPKRQRSLEDAIHETQPDATISKLNVLCRTRWVQCIDRLEISNLSILLSQLALRILQ